MIDALAAAASTVVIVARFLAGGSKAGAKNLAGAGEEHLLAWLRMKVAGPAREALADLEHAPESADEQADLRRQLTKLLEGNPELLAELRPLLPATEAAERMDQHVEGAGAKGAQIKGSGNMVTM